MKQLIFIIFSAITLNSLAQSQANYVIMNQYANDMVYDSLNSKVLITIPSKDNVHGNSIGYLNPDSAILSNYYFIGSEPRPLAITDNFKYLYVGLDGSKNVKKFNISTHTSELTFNVGFDSYDGQFFANNLSCKPGTDSVVALVRRTQDYSRGVFIYNNGVKLTDTISQYPTTIDLVHFYSPTVLFGYNNSNTGFDFSKMLVNSKGVNMINHFGSQLSGFGNDFCINKGLALSDNGYILDLSGENPYSLAKISVPTTQGFGIVRSCFDTSSNLICFATKGFWNDSIYIFRYNATTFLKHDQILVNGFKDEVNKIICWGKSKYIVSTLDGKLLVINGILPTVSTKSIDSVTSSSAKFYGEVITQGSSIVNNRGVCWDIKPNPTISSSSLNNGAGIGSFNATINNLIPNTTYYVRAFATNTEGTSYGNEISFTTLGVTGLNHITDKNITVFLNPEDNMLSINGSKGNLKIIISDISGRLIINKQLVNNQIDVSNMQNGIYIVRIETEQGYLEKMIIK